MNFFIIVRALNNFISNTDTMGIFAYHLIMGKLNLRKRKSNLQLNILHLNNRYNFT